MWHWYWYHCLIGKLVRVRWCPALLPFGYTVADEGTSELARDVWFKPMIEINCRDSWVIRTWSSCSSKVVKSTPPQTRPRSCILINKDADHVSPAAVISALSLSPFSDYIVMSYTKLAKTRTVVLHALQLQPKILLPKLVVITQSLFWVYGISRPVVRSCKCVFITSPPEGVARYCFHPVCLSVCVSVCLSVCVSVCQADILVFYFSAIERDIDLKFIQDTYRVILIGQSSRSQGRYIAFWRYSHITKTEP